MRKIKNKVSAQKIEFDDKTNEPKIVQVPLSKLSAEQKLTDKANQEIEKFAKLSGKEQVKQITMNRVFGLNNASENTAIDKRQKVFKNIFSVLFIVLVISVLVYTAYNDFFVKKSFLNFKELNELFKSTWFYSLVGLAALFFTYLFKALKISIMSRAITGKWHFGTSFGTAVIGNYYNNVTPFAIGGQPFEIYYLNKHGIDGGASAAIPIGTYVLNQFAFVIIGLASLILYNNNLLNYDKAFYGSIPDTIKIFAIIGMCLTLVMPTLITIFCIFPKLASILVKFVITIGSKLRIVKNPKQTTYKTLKSVCQNAKYLKFSVRKPLVFIPSILFSIGETLAYSSIAYFTLRFFGFNWEAPNIIEWSQAITICVIISLAVSFIPTPGNSGAADFSFYTLFEGQLAAGLAFPAMITWRLLNFYSFIIIGFLFTRIAKLFNRNNR